MLSRTFVSSLMLLFVANLVLANCAMPTRARPSLPLTPPPIASPAAPFAPLSSLPSATGTVAEGAVLPTATAISISPLPVTAVITATPTLSATLLLTEPVTFTETVILTPTAEPILLPTVTPTPALVLLPTPTPTPPGSPAPVATAAIITPTVVTAAAFTTPTIPLPPSYQVQGSFASQTIYTASSPAAQQGTFTIVQAATANAYGANQQYTLRTERTTGGLSENISENVDGNVDGNIDEINVYQVDDYIAVNFTGDEWMLVRRDQGSNIVRAIQPITDLALLFPRIINQAELIDQEEIAGISTLHYRIDDPAGQGARLIQPLLALTGEIRSLNLDVWIAVPGGYVAAYDFQVELAGARVLDPTGNEVRADQTVTWTYQLNPVDQPQPITWPAGAPTPDAFPVPGFAPGTFPIPTNTELLALVGGVPDLTSTLTVTAIDSFYRSELFALGWTVEGEGGLLRCSKEGVTFQLLIVEDTATGGTRISILPGE